MPVTRANTLPRRDEHDSNSEGDTVAPGSPTQPIQAQAEAKKAGSAGERRGPAGGSESLRVPIYERPYCTHECLLALCQGRRADPLCRNAADHDTMPPSHNLLYEIKRHIETDPARAVELLYIHDAYGAMLKICLPSHGYTFIAKAVDKPYEARLRHEADVYDQLRPLQGKVIPVCYGMTNIDVPIWYRGVPLTSLLLMSWAGESLGALNRRLYAEEFEYIFDKCIPLRENAFETIRAHGVFHGHSSDRNVRYNQQTEQLMIVDFDRTMILDPLPLGEPSPNRGREAASLSGEKTSRTSRLTKYTGSHA